MDPKTMNVVQTISKQAVADYIYWKLTKKMAWLELEFAEIVGTLSSEKGKILQDYADTLEELDQRLLELACEFLDVGEDGLLKPRTITTTTK